jgi:glycine cleavage system H protein
VKNIYSKELIFPEDVYYSQELLWVKEQGGNRVRIGICDIAVKSVKHLQYVKISCRRGAQVNKGESLGYVETTKGVWEIIAPLSGTVVEINSKVATGNAGPIDHDPYGNGWLVELETAGDVGSELEALMKGSDAKTKEWIHEKVEEVVPLRIEDEDDDE